MRVFVKLIDNKSVTVQCTPSSTVYDVKAAVEHQEGIPAHSFRLLYLQRDLEDGRELSDYAVEEDSVLCLIPRMRGGDLCYDSCSSMLHKTRQEFAIDAPDYRGISPGFNVEGMCRNPHCEAYQQFVWSNLRFSHGPEDLIGLDKIEGFDMSKVVKRAPCPSCKAGLKNGTIRACGFFLCEYAFFRLHCEVWEIVGNGRADDELGLVIYPGDFESIAWTSLIIAVKPLYT